MTDSLEEYVHFNAEKFYQTPRLSPAANYSLIILIVCVCVLKSVTWNFVGINFYIQIKVHLSFVIISLNYIFFFSALGIELRVFLVSSIPTLLLLFLNFYTRSLQVIQAGLKFWSSWPSLSGCWDKSYVPPSPNSFFLIFSETFEYSLLINYKINV